MLNLVVAGISDRGSEFTSQLIHQLAYELGFVMIFTSLYTPTGNSIIETAHQFLKHSISKIINDKQVEWDTVCHIAAMAFNVFTTRTDQESPFFLMFHRDCFMPTLTQFLQPKLRYIGNSHMHTSLDAVKELYTMNIMSLKQARDQDQLPNSKTTPPQFQMGNRVLTKNHNRYSLFDTKCIPSYRIVKLVSGSATDVQDRWVKLEE